MSYLVLARKYRPQTFGEVVGQEHVTRTLQNAIRRGRIHHAFLFCGARGTGKTTTARILAKALSCIRGPTPEPCNVCEACVEIARGTSVDVQEIDAASQNRVEDIRELREAIRYAPVRGKKKLYILDEVHMLSTSAFNALLKTLEEPPPHAVFVFATTDPHKLPATILSRVQRYDFRLLPTARLVEHLADILTRESVPFERAALQLIAREGAGSVRDALSLLDQVLASTDGTLTEEQAALVLGVADRSLLLALGRAVTGRDPVAALRCIETAYNRGYDLAQLARALLGHLRDLVVASVVPEPEGLLEAVGSELEEIRQQAAAARGAAELLFSRMIRIAEEVSRSPLPRYVLEVGVVELCRVEPLAPLGELVDRLELLESRLEAGLQSGSGSGTARRSPAAPPPTARRPAERAGEPLRPLPTPSCPESVGAGSSAPAARPSFTESAGGGSSAPAARPSFTELVRAVIHRAPTLSVLAAARPLRWDGTSLTLGFSKAFELEQARAKLAEIGRLVSEQAGHPVSVRLEKVEAAPEASGAESLAEAEERQRAEERAARRREALSHPSRKQLTEVFGDDVVFLDPVLE
ncbi:MAG: DNA polymerase III subunit gamma/tau [Myxococcales bacterium]|nr:DNA polymerase III subunit gamma/tau [Myxococcota bacterium]MDW8283329.1 DNA polymerase III subunit gamma/tau [Myxococcales bacterium]